MNSPITKLPDGSGCFTATIMSDEEAKALPLKERPLNHRISSEMYHAVFEAIGTASMCWHPRPSDGTFDTAAAEKVAVALCFKIANEIEVKLTKPEQALKQIFNATDPYADGAPDASAHDKLCNEIASLSRKWAPKQINSSL